MADIFVVVCKTCAIILFMVSILMSLYTLGIVCLTNVEILTALWYVFVIMFLVFSILGVYYFVRDRT